MSDAQIENIRPVQWEPRELTIPGPKIQTPKELTDVFEKYNLSDSSIMRNGEIKFRMDNTLTFGDVKAIRVQDIMVREIIESNDWDRPIYFAVTCSEDSKIGLHDYLRMEGMAFRLIPEKRKPGIEFINEKVVSKQIVENPGYSKDYKPGFKFRGLNDSQIFFDENHRRMSQNYRNAFMRLTIYYINTNQNKLAIQALDNMEAKIPRNIIDMPFGLLYEVANLYYSAGSHDKYKEFAKEVEDIALKNLEENPNDVQSYYNPYRVLMDLYENLKEYNKALELWQRLAVMYPNDPTVKTNIEKYKNLTGKEKVEIDSVPK